MNSNTTTLARAVLSLFAGLLVWSSWSLQPARMVPKDSPSLRSGAALAAAGLAAPRATGLPVLGKDVHPSAAKESPLGRAPRARLELERRLSRAVADPARASRADLDAVRSAFGPDSSRMLELLRQASN